MTPNLLHAFRHFLMVPLFSLIAIGAFIASAPIAEAAEKSDKPLAVRLDFIIGGKHAPWYVAQEKGFYSKRGITASIQPGTGSADTVRAVGAGIADVGFADITTAIVARSRGTPVIIVAQLGYVPTTILWRDDTNIKNLKDLEGKSWAISPGQAQWYLMPAFCKINNIDCKSMKVNETSAALQPAALVAKKVDFIVMFRASNDEVTEIAATKQGIKLKRVYMRENGLDMYGSALIVKDEDVKRNPEMIRAYVEGTMEGLRYSRDHRDEALQILLKQKPELDKELTRIQLKNAVEEVFIPRESLDSGFGFMKPEIMEKTIRITNDFFDGARKVSLEEVYTNQFIKK